LSGALPDLTMDEAMERANSPSGKRRTRRDSTDSIDSNVDAEKKVAPLPAKKRPITIEEEPEKEAMMAAKMAAAISKDTTAAKKKITISKDTVKVTTKNKIEKKSLTQDEKLERLVAAMNSVRKISSNQSRKKTCPWKSDRDRFNSVVKSRGLKSSLQQRQRAKEVKDKAKALQKDLKDDRVKKIDDLKQRREDNKTRREANARKNEIVQVIKNPAKIKRMRKKQLRMLAKRDTTEVVPPGKN
jgi:rRNA-processing protein CGR1